MKTLMYENRIKPKSISVISILLLALRKFVSCMFNFNSHNLW